MHSIFYYAWFWLKRRIFGSNTPYERILLARFEGATQSKTTQRCLFGFGLAISDLIKNRKH